MLLQFEGSTISATLAKLVFNGKIWMLWRERNARLHTGTTRHKYDLLSGLEDNVRVRLAGIQVKEVVTPAQLQILANWDFRTAIDRGSDTIMYWHKPEAGWLKLNTDGAVCKTHAGFGGLIRNQEAEVLLIFHYKCQPVHINSIELEAIMFGLRAALVVFGPRRKV